MNKLGIVLLTGILTLFSVGVSFEASAKEIVGSTTSVVIQGEKSIDSILRKPTEQETTVAKMQWIQGVPHNKLEKVYLSAILSEKMFNEIKDKENLAFKMTDLIDKAFENSGIKITPFAYLEKQAKSDKELQSLLTQYDSGITIVLEKQDKGEVIIRAYLETPENQLTYANYACRSLYGKNGSYDAKVLAFNKALRGFVDEIKDYKAGKVKL